MDFIKYVNEQLLPKKEVPAFRAGDNITVYYKIVEGEGKDVKERIQAFRGDRAFIFNSLNQGDVIQIKGGPANAARMITVRKISGGIGVERVFPACSPNIDKIEVNKFGKVRRARLYYLRKLSGKKARIPERRMRKEA